MQHDLMITIQSLEMSIPGSEKDTFLDSLRSAGIDYPHGCETGLCGLCKSRLISGEISHLSYYESALSGQERDAGLMLPCSAMPLTDCVITPVRQDVNLPNVVSLNTIVTSIEALTHDMVRLELHSADDKDIEFLAGQYCQLSFGDSAGRNFSMASAPGDGRLVFFIRRIPGGAVTNGIIPHLAPGASAQLKGPYGTAYLREDHVGPMLMVAGGSGLAPIWSMVRTAIYRGMTQPIDILFGVRSEQDIYLHSELQQLCAAHDNVTVSLALSQPAPGYEAGHLHDVLRARYSGMSLADWAAYIAGPPVMVEAVSQVLQAQGIPKSRCFTDPFLIAGESRPQIQHC